MATPHTFLNSPWWAMGQAVPCMSTMYLRPSWKPTAPKRFAWLLGASLGVTYLTMRLLHVDAR